LYDYYQSIGHIRRRQEEILRKKKKIQKAIHYLKKANLIQINGQEIKLSNKGRIRLIINKSLEKSLKNKSKKKKNSNFYLIIFDIPEKHRRIRDLFRRVLYNFGADMIQKSVFLIKEEKSFLYVQDLVQECEIKDFVKLIKCNKIIN